MRTLSTSADETTRRSCSSGGFDPSDNGGYRDAFVAKLSSAGGHLWSTYLGGSDRDDGWGVAADAAGGVYVTGTTQSAGRGAIPRSFTCPASAAPLRPSVSAEWARGAAGLGGWVGHAGGASGAR